MILEFEYVTLKGMREREMTGEQRERKGFLTLGMKRQMRQENLCISTLHLCGHRRDILHSSVRPVFPYVQSAWYHPWRKNKSHSI